MLFEELISIYEDLIEQYELTDMDDDRLESAIWKMDMIFSRMYFSLDAGQREKIRTLFRKFHETFDEKHPYEG